MTSHAMVVSLDGTNYTIRVEDLPTELRVQAFRADNTAIGLPLTASHQSLGDFAQFRWDTTVLRELILSALDDIYRAADEGK